MKFDYLGVKLLASLSSASDGGGDGGGSRSRPSSSASTARHKDKSQRVTASPDVGNITDGLGAMSPSDVDETPTGTTGIDATTTGGTTTGGTSLGFTPVNDFNHSDEIVSDVMSLLQSTISNSAYSERLTSHHANGMVPSLRIIMNSPNRDAMIANVLNDFCPEILKMICSDDYDCNRTSEEEEFQLRNEIHNGVFLDTLNVIACGYKKSVSGPVEKWKEAESLVEDDLDDYSDDLREMVVKASETINELGLTDGDVYTSQYIGESAYMSFEQRAVDGKYPHFMYELAHLLDTTVVETKVSSATPFDKKHSLFNEAFLAVLMMSATDRTRKKKGEFKPCKILLYDGTGCNKVRAGVREHHSNRFTSSGKAINNLFKRNYKHYGEIVVMSDKFTVENLAPGTSNEEIVRVRSFLGDFEDQIRKYIADPVKRKKTGRPVIDAPDHPLSILDVCQFWGYYNGTKSKELGRGIFSKEYLERVAELARGLFWEKFKELQKYVNKYGLVTIDTGDGSTVDVLFVYSGAAGGGSHLQLFHWYVDQVGYDGDPAGSRVPGSENFGFNAYENVETKEYNSLKELGATYNSEWNRFAHRELIRKSVANNVSRETNDGLEMLRGQDLNAPVPEMDVDTVAPMF